MAGLNKAMIIGYLGRDPEMRYTPNGSAVTSFSVGVSRQWTGQNGPQKETEWFNVVAWEKLAEQCNQSLHKGSQVYVEGRLQTHSWDAADGQKKYKTELIASSVQYLDPRGPRGTDSGSVTPEDEFSGEKEVDDLPF